MIKIWRVCLRWIISNPVRYFLVALTLLTLILISLDYFSMFLFLGSKEQREQDWRSVLTEGHGMWFDILILGVLLSIYERLRAQKESEIEIEKQKQDKIDRYKEEIDDYRGWEEKEASHRIAGNIRRLNKLGVTKIDLSGCYLKGANLENVDLSGAILNSTNLEDANLNFINLSNATVGFCNMKSVKMTCAILNKTLFIQTNLSEAKIYGVRLENTEFKLNNVFENIKVDEIVLNHFKFGIKGEDSEKKNYYCIDKNGNGKDYIAYNGADGPLHIVRIWILQKTEKS